MKKMAYHKLHLTNLQQMTSPQSSPQIEGVLAVLENTIVLSVNIYDHFNTQETKAIGRGILALLLDGIAKSIQPSSKELVGGPAHSRPMLLEDCC